MKKQLLSVAVAAALSTVAFGAQANALPNNGTVALSINAGTGFAPGTGSYFLMSGNPGAELLPGTGKGLVLGGTTVNGQGDPTSTAIVAGWSYFGLPGYNFIDTTIGDANSTAPSDNGNGTLNLGAWTVNWNGGNIDMSAGAPATFACSGGSNCAVGDSYTLDYQATVPSGSFKGVVYNLHLEGNVVSAVPVPAAVWLFGSGLIGLVGVGRRKKTA